MDKVNEKLSNLKNKYIFIRITRYNLADVSGLV